MAIGDKLKIVHDLSRTCDAGRVVWICGHLLTVRLIDESELGTDYAILHVNN